LLQVPTAQPLTDEIDFGRSNSSQRLYAETGHSIGHSPAESFLAEDELPTPQELTLHPEMAGSRSVINRVIRAWLAGLRPEAIQTEFPDLRLCQIYAAIALYLERKEVIERVVADRPRGALNHDGSS
jgi:uncharacterized protein (DUF433 family)